MSQHDYDISTADANTGVTMRAAINAALQALAGNNSGATEPATKYPYMWWADTTSGYLKQRNAANTAWITVMLLATALMSDSDKCDGFHASQTPSANQIPVLNSSGRLVLDGTDDGSSKIQTGGVIKAGGLKLSDTNEIKWGDGSCKISGSGSTGIITLTGNLSIKNIYGTTLAINNYSGANSTGGNVWIGGGGTSSIGESGATYKGSGNFAAGNSALYSATSAYWNAASGYTALYGITTGHANTAAGYAAGRFIAGGSVLNTISTSSLYLGAATKAGADGNTNEIVIGFNTTGMGSNTAILGNSNITHTYLRGQVLIGTTTPQVGVAATINGPIVLQSNSSPVGMITAGSTINTFRSSTILGLYSGGLDTNNEHLRLTSAGRILAGPTLPTDNGVDALQVNGTIASKGIKLDGTASSDVNTLDYYKEGTFTATGTGFSNATPPSSAWYYVRVGKQVTISTGLITGTSNTTTFTVTGLPSELIPPIIRNCMIRIRDNGGALILGLMQIGTGGTLSIFKTPNGDVFTASGNKAIYPSELTYML